MGKKKETLEDILRTLGRIEDLLVDIADNTYNKNQTNVVETPEEEEFLTEAEVEAISAAEEELYEDK